MSSSTRLLTSAGAVVLCGAVAFAQPRIATGSGHGVLLKPDGTVWTWGSNTRGQLGLGDGEEASLPRRVPGMDAVRDIAAGADFSLALKSDGSVWSWGYNEYGQLGVGTTATAFKPARIAALSNITAVAAAGKHALALKSDGTVWEWGDDPARSHKDVPKQVPGFTGAAAIAAGETHSVALKSDGTVWVWGDHGAGDLGNRNYGLAYEPLRMPGLADVKAIGAAYRTTVAVKNDGSLWAVGYGAAGQLGNGATADSLKPVPVSGLTGVKAVVGGNMHLLALKADGTVWGWGANRDGQSGNLRAADTEHVLKPLRSGTLTGVVAIAAAANHSLAVTSDGAVWGWGDNQYGALGTDTEKLQRSSVPMRIGTDVPDKCNPLFSCQTSNQKYIQLCADQSETDADKWSRIQYRFGPGDGPPDLVYPKSPASGAQPFYFSHISTGGDYQVSVRFTSGAYTYRVFSGSHSGAGVDVIDAAGKRLARVACGERPYMFSDYMRMAMQCDDKSPHGVAACKKDPLRVK